VVDRLAKGAAVATIVAAVSTAVAAGAAALAAWLSYNQQQDAKKLQEAQTISAVSGQAIDLYAEIEVQGIKNEATANKLTFYFYILSLYKQREIISPDTFRTQVEFW
jgi:hypothetical protein